MHRQLLHILSMIVNIRGTIKIAIFTVYCLELTNFGTNEFTNCQIYSDHFDSIDCDVK